MKKSRIAFTAELVTWSSRDRVTKMARGQDCYFIREWF